MFWVISVYFNIRNTLPKSGTFFLGHPVYIKKIDMGHAPLVVEETLGKSKVCARFVFQEWILSF